MKKKRIFLNSWIFLVLLTVSLMTLMYIGNAITNVNTIEDTYLALLQEKMIATRDSILETPEGFPTAPVSGGGQSTELGYYIEIADHSQFVMNDAALAEQSSSLKEKLFASAPLASALANKQELFKKITVLDSNNDELLFLTDVHFFERDGKAGTIIIFYNLAELQSYHLNAKSMFWLLLTIFLMGAIAYYQYLDRKVSEPLEAMTDIAFKYSRNDFSKKIRVETYDEISNLGIAMSKLGKAIQASTLMNKEEKELLTHLFESLPGGIIYFDQNMNLTLVNGFGKEFLDFWRKADPDSENKVIPDQFREMILNSYDTATSAETECQWQQRYFNVKVTPLVQADSKQVRGVLIVLQDITTAKQLDTIRGDFITNVSHDLRTPLQMIKGYSEAIIDNIAETNEEKIEMAHIILDETTEMNNMVNNLLDLSRMQAGYIELDRHAVDLAAFFEHLSVRFEKSFKESEIHFSFELLDGIDHYPFDEEKMNQVFYNLIDNAIRYSAEIGTRQQKFIHIEVSLDDLSDKVLFEVSDNGIGIQQESLPYIFERFYKDDKSRTNLKQKSTGIGLAIVQTIVAAHDGKIEVYSELGVGTTFIISLPDPELI